VGIEALFASGGFLRARADGMNIRVKCPACGKTGTVPSTFNGRKGRCKICGFFFVFAEDSSDLAPIGPKDQNLGRTDKQIGGIKDSKTEISDPSFPDIDLQNGSAQIRRSASSFGRRLLAFDIERPRTHVGKNPQSTDSKDTISITISRRQVVAIGGVAFIIIASYLSGRLSRDNGQIEGDFAYGSPNIENSTSIDTGSSRNEEQRTSSNDSMSSTSSDAYKVQQVFGEIFRQAQAEQRRSEDIQRALQQASVCPRCGGAGTYRYVENGLLIANSCPSCMGTGRAY
jgi:hypothetical protein